MHKEKLLDLTSFIIFLITLIFSFLLFWNNSAEASKSMTAAILAAALVWLSYVILRWFWLAIK